MIVLYNPKVTKPRNRRMPLSVLALAAVLEGKEEYAIVDGNLDPSPTATITGLMKERHVEALGVTVMPSPQIVSAVTSCRELRARFPQVPIVWGGYFPSLYTAAALNAPYVDFAVRSQGEETFLELLQALRGERDFRSIAGLAFKDKPGEHRHNPERMMKSPGDFPWFPYHRIPVENYLLPTFLGRRTAVHQASAGCPYACNFCGVISAYRSREKMEAPALTEGVLRHLVSTYGADSVQFFDNNFFLREDHARELAERLESLRLRWWCEARIDILLRYSDVTLEALRRAGCAMIFFGAEAGSDWALQEMNKNLTTEQTLELARIARPGADVYLSNFRPAAHARGWQRTFRHGDELVEAPSCAHSLDSIRREFESAGFQVVHCEEPHLGEPEGPIFAWRGKADFLAAASETPALYVFHFRARQRLRLEVA